MAVSRTMVLVFLASPGDLPEERVAAKAVVDKFNAQWAEFFGIGVQLVGWEDTVSQFGRPQETINRDLARCELFIGVMHRKWGTPPSVDGEFTSGFEEEFELSIRSRRESKRPEMSMFFKKIAPEFMVDKGPDLLKVLAFKERLVKEKELYFEEFESKPEFEEKIEKRIIHYVQNLANANKERSEEDTKQTPSDETSPPEVTKSKHNPLSQEGVDFLKQFIGNVEEDEDGNPVAPSEIARFRLLSMIVSSNGNDEVALGTHDANLLYRQRDAVLLSRREMNGLIRSALNNVPHETIPLWHWYVAAEAEDRGYLSLMSFVGSESERAGAISAMTLIHDRIKDIEPLDPPHGGFLRDDFIRIWFDDENEDSVKTAALEYLAVCGVKNDIPSVREAFEKGNYQTKGPAIDAIVSINLRYSREEAVKSLLDLQPESIGQRIVDTVFEKPDQIDNVLLVRGIAHRNASVRRAAVSIMRKRKIVLSETAERLLEDSDAEVRYMALSILVDDGREYSDEQAKAILVKPQARGGLGALFSPMSTYTDPSGNAVWERFKKQKDRTLSDEMLENLIKTEAFFEGDARFALDFKQFGKRADKLRHDVDDQFKSVFSAAVKEAEERFPDIVNKLKSIEDFSRHILTGRGADILAEKSQAADLARIRKVLADGFVDFTSVQVAYIKRHGEWQDISLLASLTDRRNRSNALLLSYVDDDKMDEIADAIHKIANGRLRELWEAKLPKDLMRRILRRAASKDFKALTDEVILEMFHSQYDDVRKQAALAAIRSLPKAHLKKLMRAYTEHDGSRFYNVIYWLDLGIALDRTKIQFALAVVKRRER